jgi:hypothetical protein
VDEGADGHLDGAPDWEADCPCGACSVDVGGGDDRDGGGSWWPE